jgi:hypothetical protein
MSQYLFGLLCSVFLDTYVSIFLPHIAKNIQTEFSKFHALLNAIDHNKGKTCVTTILDHHVSEFKNPFPSRFEVFTAIKIELVF